MSIEEKKLKAKKILAERKLAGQEAPDEDYMPVRQEMHPDVSTGDRLLIKNLAQNPEVGVKYLQKKLKEKYPDQEKPHSVRIKQGEIQLKGPGEQEFRVVDPDTGFFSKDMLRDAGDVLYDTVSGIGQGIGTAKAALLAGPGALPVGMAASGVLGGAAEALKQKLGKQLGLDQQVDWGDAGISAGVSTLGTGLFGTGAKAGTKALQASNRGAFGRMWDATSGARNKVGEAASTIKANVIDYTKNNFPRLQALAKEEAPVTAVIENLKQGNQNVDRIRQAAGARIEQGVKNAPPGLKLDVTKHRDTLQSLIDELKELTIAEPDVKTYAARIKSYEKIRDELFDSPQVSVPKAYHDMKTVLEELSQVRNMKEGEIHFGKSVTKEDKKLALVANKLRKDLGDQIAKATGTEADNAIYSQAMRDGEYFSQFNQDIPAVENKLGTLFSKPGRVEKAKAIDKRYGTNIVDSANTLRSYKSFFDPESMVKLRGRLGAGALGATIGGGIGYMAGRGMGDGFGGVGAGIGAGLGAGAGAILGGPQSLKMYMQAAKASGRLDEALREIKRLGIPLTDLGVDVNIPTGGLPALYNKLFERSTAPGIKQQLNAKEEK
jgi:hypothetical protein